MEDKELMKELDAMINLSTEAPGTESPSTQAPGTQAPGTDAPGTGAPSTNAPATKAPTTEAPIEGDELARIREENESLRKKLEEALTGPKTKAPATTAPGTRAPTTEAPSEEKHFLSDEDDLYEITRDPEKFNKLLNRVYKSGVEDASKRLGGSQPDISSLVSQHLNVALALKEASERFYEDNQDLRPFKKVVGVVYEDVVNNHPDWTIEQCLEETGKEARKRLELSAPKPTDEKGKGNKPTLPPGSKGGKRGSGNKPKQSPLLSEIEEMNKSLE